MSSAVDYVQLTHAASEIDGTIDEVYAARGSYGNLSLKIASKQDELSQSQLAAANSGITAEKLTADEAVLDWNVNHGVKNLLSVNDGSGTNITLLSQSGIIKSGKYIMSFKASNSSGNYALSFYDENGVLIGMGSLNGAITADKSVSFTLGQDAYTVKFFIKGTATISELMLRPASIADSTFQPYALPNPTITPAVIKAVDEGAKNHCTLASGSSTQSTRWINIPVSNVGVGQWVMSFGTLTSTDTDDTLCQATCFNSSDQQVSNWVNFKREPNTNKIFTTTDTVSYVRLYPANSYAASMGDTVTFTKGMICTAADWAVSQKFVPYCPSMQEMYQMILALQNGTRSAPALALATAEPEEAEPETGEEETR